MQGSAKVTIKMGTIDPKERLCVQGSAKVTMKLWCNSSKGKIVCAG